MIDYTQSIWLRISKACGVLYISFGLGYQAKVFGFDIVPTLGGSTKALLSFLR